MPSKNFGAALKNQGRGGSAAARNGGSIALFGDTTQAVREILEGEAEELIVRDIAIEYLEDNPFQYLARPELDQGALDELAASIKQNGFYGSLLARPKKNKAGYYELAYGHRRRAAAILAGLTHLPVKILTDLSDNQMARIMASENFSREELKPLGEANVVGYLYNQHNMTAPQIAEAVGKKRGWVMLRLSLYQAPDDVKELSEKQPDTLGHISYLLQVKDPAQRAILIKEIIEDGLTRESLQRKVRTLLAPPTSVEKGTVDSQSSLVYPPPQEGQIVTNVTTSLPLTHSEKNNNNFAVPSSTNRVSSVDQLETNALNSSEFTDGSKVKRTQTPTQVHTDSDAASKPQKPYPNSSPDQIVSSQETTSTISDAKWSEALRELEVSVEVVESLAKDQGFDTMNQRNRNYLRSLVERLKLLT